MNFVNAAIPSLTDKKTTEALRWLFARKNEGISPSTHMSPLINAVMEDNLSDVGAKLIQDVAERIDKYIKENKTRIKNDKTTDYTHILNLSARLWAQCARYYRDVKYDESLMDKYTDLSLKTLGEENIDLQEGFQDLYHMAGMCWHKKLSGYLEKNPDDNSEQSLLKIKNLYSVAWNYYDKCVQLGNEDYGLPSMMELFTLVIQYVYNILGFISGEYRPEKFNDDKFNWVLSDVIDVANSTIEDVDQYRLNDEAQAMFIERASKFRKTYLLNDSGKMLQDLSNYINRLNCDGDDRSLSLQYAYSQMVDAIMDKYYDKNKKAFDYLKLFIDKHQFEKLKEYVNCALEYPGGKTNHLYKIWFKLAKIEDISFSIAYQKAVDWSIALQNSRRISRNWNIYLPYYYMYTISLLSGQPEDRVKDDWESLQKNIGNQNKNDEFILDYYASNKTGLGCLVDRDWAMIDDIANNEMISWVTGRIIYISDDEAAGWINTIELSHLTKRQHKGEGQIFFKPRTAEKTQNQRMDEVRLKFGFTLMRLRAVDITLVVRKSKIKKQDNELLKHDIFTPKWLYPDENNPVLLIGEVNGEKAAIHIKDIKKYNATELKIFNGEKEVLIRLLKAKPFSVIIKNKDFKKGHDLSLFDTKQKLIDIIK